MQKVAAELDDKAIQLADSKTGEVFVQAFKSMLVKEQLDFDDEEHFKNMDIRSRHLGCGCWLCKLRYEYTWRKLERNKCYKRYTNDEYIYMTGSCATVRDFTNYQEEQLLADKKRVEELDIELAQILTIKNLIKSRLGYDKHKKSTRVPDEIPIHGWGIQNLRTDLFL